MRITASYAFRFDVLSWLLGPNFVVSPGPVLFLPKKYAALYSSPGMLIRVFMFAHAC